MCDGWVRLGWRRFDERMGEEKVVRNFMVLLGKTDEVRCVRASCVSLRWLSQR